MNMKSLAQTVSGGHLELAINQISRRGAGRSAMETWLAPVSHLRHSALRCASGDAYDGGCGAPPPQDPAVPWWPCDTHRHFRWSVTGTCDAPVL